MNIPKKKVLITGAAKRLGKALAIHLAKQGCHIIVHFNHSKVEALELIEEIRSINAHCELRQADFNNEEEIKELVNNVEFNLLINNASTFTNDNYLTCNFASLETHMRVNVGAPILLSKYLFEKLKKRNHTGNIINILDYNIDRLPKNFLSYSLSKHALRDYTKLAASLMAPLIRVNAIALGNIIKNVTQSSVNFENAKEASPLKIKATVEEVCQTIDFILKIHSLTGQVIHLDGGKHLPTPEPL